MLLFAIVIIFLAVVNLGFFLFAFDGFFGKEDFSSNRETVKNVADIVSGEHVESGRLYDLGSGHGGFAINLSQALPQLKITGIDDSLFRTLFARTRSIFSKKVRFKKNNIFSEEISSANIIYLYLPQEMMHDLEKKLQKELKPGTIVICNKVTFPSWQPAQKFNQLSMYRI